MHSKKFPALFTAVLLVLTMVAGCGRTPAASAGIQPAAAVSSSGESGLPAPLSGGETADAAARPEPFTSEITTGTPPFELVETTCSITASYTFQPPDGMERLPDAGGRYTVRYTTPEYPDDRTELNGAETAYLPAAFLMGEEAYKQHLAEELKTQYGPDVSFTLDAYGASDPVGGYPALVGLCTVQTKAGALRQMQVFVDAPDTYLFTLVDDSPGGRWIDPFMAALATLRFDIVQTVGVGNISLQLRGPWKAEQGQMREMYFMPGRAGYMDAFLLGEVSNAGTEEAAKSLLEGEKDAVLQAYQELADAGYRVENEAFERTDTGAMIKFALLAPEDGLDDAEQYSFAFCLVLNGTTLQMVQFSYLAGHGDEARAYIADVYGTMKMENPAAAAQAPIQ